MEDSIQMDIHAIGMMGRAIYCGAYRDITATSFHDFRMWTRE
jgi:hypothetical protein